MMGSSCSTFHDVTEFVIHLCTTLNQNNDIKYTSTGFVI